MQKYLYIYKLRLFILSIALSLIYSICFADDIITPIYVAEIIANKSCKSDGQVKLLISSIYRSIGRDSKAQELYKEQDIFYRTMSVGQVVADLIDKGRTVEAQELIVKEMEAISKTDMVQHIRDQCYWQIIYGVTHNKNNMESILPYCLETTKLMKHKESALEAIAVKYAEIGDVLHSNEVLEQINHKSPVRLRAMMAIAKLYLKEKRVEVLEKYNKILGLLQNKEVEKWDTEIASDLIAGYFELKEYKKAEDVIYIQPVNYEFRSRVDIAERYITIGKYQKAIELFKKNEYIDKIIKLIVKAYTEKGEFEKALEACNKMEGKYGEYLEALIGIYLEIEKSKVKREQIIQLLDTVSKKTIEFDPEYFDRSYNCARIAEAYRRFGEKKKSDNIMTIAIEEARLAKDRYGDAFADYKVMKMAAISILCEKKKDDKYRDVAIKEIYALLDESIDNSYKSEILLEVAKIYEGVNIKLFNKFLDESCNAAMLIDREILDENFAVTKSKYIRPITQLYIINSQYDKAIKTMEGIGDPIIAIYLLAEIEVAAKKDNYKYSENNLDILRRLSLKEYPLVKR